MDFIIGRTVNKDFNKRRYSVSIETKIRNIKPLFKSDDLNKYCIIIKKWRIPKEYF